MHTEGKISVEDGHYPCMRELKGLSFGVTVVVSASDIPFELFLRRTDDMRRLVACWNACQGVATEVIEDGVVQKLREDRDQLLAKLNSANAEIRALEARLLELEEVRP